MVSYILSLFLNKKKTCHKCKGTICIIEKVCKHWHFGFYEHAVYRLHNTLSHGTMYIKNISSLDEHIIDTVLRFSKYVKFDKENVPPEDISVEERYLKFNEEIKKFLEESNQT